MFLRNGPNPQFPPLGRYHWFDGDGMVHGVLIEDGKALYRIRYVRTAGFLAEQQEGKAIWPGILNLPRFDYPHGILIKNVANTSLVVAQPQTLGPLGSGRTLLDGFSQPEHARQLQF